MISRREYEDYHGKVTDTEWEQVCKAMCEAMDRIWEENHKLDE